MAYRTIEKFHVGSAFKLPPAALALCLPQSLALANGCTGRNCLHILDASNDFEVHAAAPLSETRADDDEGVRPYTSVLAAATGAAATHAAVAAAVSGHDAAAEAAAWGIAQVDDA
jgi:hypothetical protein